MKTEVFYNSTGNAAELLKEGGLVAVPTETVYGLACNALDENAVKQLYEVKNRPEIKPLALMVRGAEDIDLYCTDVPSYGRKFAAAHWPGPVSVIFTSRPCVPELVRAGGDTVSLRCPDSELTLKLLFETGFPLAAPSANPAGEASPKNAQDVLNYFDGKIAAVIDGGECRYGVASMIVDFSGESVRVLRNGPLNMRILGMTGTSGSGKTTALSMLREELGAGVIECDSLYHEMLSGDKDLNADLKREFPDCYQDGMLNRKALAKVVFSDPDKLTKLNRITHGHICCEVLNRLMEMQSEGYKTSVIEAVELLSSGLSELCDKTIAVVAPEEPRVRRIMERDNLTEEEARNRIRSQKSADYYKDNCDVTIENDGTLSQLHDKIMEAVK